MVNQMRSGLDVWIAITVGGQAAVGGVLRVKLAERMVQLNLHITVCVVFSGRQFSLSRNWAGLKGFLGTSSKLI